MAQSQDAPEALARAIFRELVEMPTTVEQGATPRAAQAIVTRLVEAGFAPEDAQIVGPDPRAPLVVARYRGTDASVRPVLFWEQRIAWCGRRTSQTSTRESLAWILMVDGCPPCMPARGCSFHCVAF